MKTILKKVKFLRDFVIYLRELFTKRKTVSFWKTADKEYWQGYFHYPKRSEFLASLVSLPKDAKILELGCGVGTNLDRLHKLGFNNLYGVEISEEAVKLLKETYPGCATIYTASIQDALKEFKDKEFDLVFTVSTLQTIPYKEDFFPDIARISKTLITLENEVNPSWYPRNYQTVFSPFMNQVKEIKCDSSFDLANFTARVLVTKEE